MSSLSPEQTACLEARAMFEVTRTVYLTLRNEQVRVPDCACDDATLDQIVAQEMALEDSTGYTAARELKLQTELALVAWAEDRIKTDRATRARFGQVAEVFTKGMRNPVIREKLIEACLRMAA